MRTDSETSLYLNVAGPAVQARLILLVCYLEVNDATVLVAVNVVFARTREDFLSCSQRQVSLSKQHPLVKFTKQAGAGAQSPSCKSLVVNGKLSVRNIVLREGRTLCFRSADTPRFSYEEVLPRPGGVQRLARLCTQLGRKISATRHFESFRSSRFFCRHLRRPPSFWPTSAPESELLIST